MSDYDFKYIYSLYNPDNGVELYESLAEAERVKHEWGKVAPVAGPFAHSRVELSLIKASQEVISFVSAFCYDNLSPAESESLLSITLKLQKALDELINQPPSS